MQKIINQTKKYYEKKLFKFGNNHKGMDWKKKNQQYLRFEVLIKFFDLKNSKVLDIGCGNGEFYKFLKKKKIKFKMYNGIDISEEMIKLCRLNFSKYKNVNFKKKNIFKDKVKKSDYVFASGLFNIKNNLSKNDWEIYVKKMILEMYNLSSQGLAFNLLTFDTTYRNNKMHYQSLDGIISFIRKKITRNIIIDHSYNLWEYTIFLKKKAK